MRSDIATPCCQRGPNHNARVGYWIGNFQDIGRLFQRDRCKGKMRRRTCLWQMSQLDLRLLPCARCFGKGCIPFDVVNHVRKGRWHHKPKDPFNAEAAFPLLRQREDWPVEQPHKIAKVSLGTRRTCGIRRDSHGKVACRVRCDDLPAISPRNGIARGR